MRTKTVGRQNDIQKEQWADRMVVKRTVGIQNDGKKEQWADKWW